MVVQERYHGKIAPANTAVELKGEGVGGFICVTAGTISIAYASGTVLLNAFPVAAGSVYGLPLLLGPNGGTLTTAGGASGVILTQ